MPFLERIHYNLPRITTNRTNSLIGCLAALTLNFDSSYAMPVLSPIFNAEARAHLIEPDWQEIAQAFAENQDPAYCVTNRGDIARLVDAVSHAPRKRG